MECPDCRRLIDDGGSVCPYCGSPTRANRGANLPAATDHDSGPFPIGGRILDEYTIERTLGYGGMGVVYLARRDLDGQRLAVKTALVDDDSYRQAILRELRVWMDLPQHPHLAACYYFRTVGSRLLLFAEYVDGGSLDAAIRRGVPAKWDQLLDLAIQAAWGLHAAHELGVVHRDVKPSNLLLTRAGVVKVCDFGISSLRSTGPRHGVTMHSEQGGMTPAYRSPEQAAGLAVTRATDQWSWAITVLEMVMGERQHAVGEAALYVLEEWSGTGDRVYCGTHVPDAFVAMLRRCFEHEPARRWPDMLQLADELQRIYRDSTGRSYPRPAPEFPLLERTEPLGMEDNVTSSAADLLRQALQADGQDEAAVGAMLKSVYFARRGRLADELVALDEARRVFQRLVNGGRSELAFPYAQTHLEIAYMCDQCGDYEGAERMFDLALDIHERLVHSDRTPDEVSRYLAIYRDKGRALGRVTERRNDALAAFDAGLDVAARLPRPASATASLQMAYDVVELLLAKGSRLHQMGQLQAARDIVESANSRLAEVAGKKPHPATIDMQMCAYELQSRIMASLGDLSAARRLSNRVGYLLEQSPESRSTAARYVQLAQVLLADGDATEAVRAALKAVLMLEVDAASHGDQQDLVDLLFACEIYALALWSCERNGEAAEIYDRGLKLYDRLIDEEGRTELEARRIRSMSCHGNVLLEMHDFSGTVRQMDDTIRRATAYLHRRDSTDIKHTLAMNYWCRGTAQRERRQIAAARDDMRSGSRLLAELVDAGHDCYRSSYESLQREIEGLR